MGNHVPLHGVPRLVHAGHLFVCVTTSAAGGTRRTGSGAAQKMEARSRRRRPRFQLSPPSSASGLLKLTHGLDEESREQVYNIEQAARRGADIAGRLLAFSRGGLARFVRIDFRDVVSETMRLAAPTFANGIEAEISLPEAPMWE
jgi:hypothetical protein